MLPSITIILVLYKTSLQDSVAYQRLKQHVGEISAWAKTHLIVYNNSPEITVNQSPDYELVNASQNDKLYGAYTYALNFATQNNFNWLMLLDQDSELSDEYFVKIKDALSDPSINQAAAIVPMFYHNDRRLSPHTYTKCFGPLWFNRNAKEGYIDKYITAFNSGTILNVSAINSIGGFPKEFPLDALDTCYLYRLHKNGYPFFVIETRMTQRLSILDYASMTRSRYSQILEAERLFAKEIGIIPNVFLRLRLCLRAVKFMTDKYKRPYIPMTIISLFSK